MVYIPKVVNQLDDSTCEGGNCGPSTAAMALDFATRGVSRTTGSAVRKLLPYPYNINCKGITIQQAAAAIERGWSSANVYNENGTILPWSNVPSLLSQERGIHLGLNYKAVRKYLPSLVGSLTFAGNHFWFGCGSSMWADPLWDGRPLSSTRKAPSPIFRTISATTMARLAASFEVDGVPLGAGRAYIGYTKVQPGGIILPPKPIGDVDMIITEPVGQDWTPKTSRKPVRNAPIRSGSASTSAIVGYIEVGQRIRSEFELTAGGYRWRLVKFKGKAGFILRDDFIDVSKRGDAVDLYFQNYADRKTP